MQLALFLGDVDDFTAFVETAVGAHAVGQALLAAVRAGNGAASLESIMGAAAVAAALGVLTLWEWCHASGTFRRL